MPIKQTRKTSATPKEPSPKQDYVELRIPKLTKASTLITAFLVILVIVLSFGLGMLYMRMQALEEKALATPPATLQDALMQYAKQLKLDTDKFEACLVNNTYTSRVDQQEQEGTNLGVRATPAFYINGKLIGGAYPYEAFKEVIDKELDGTGSTDASVYSESLQQAYADEQNRSFDPVPKEVPVGDAPVRGDQNAPVTIVEYSDFQCPFCQRAISTINQVLTDYKGKVKLVYKHYPISSIHPNAQKTAEATECAREQGKFWEYHDVLFNTQQQWSDLPQTIGA